MHGSVLICQVKASAAAAVCTLQICINGFMDGSSTQKIPNKKVSMALLLSLLLLYYFSYSTEKIFFFYLQIDGTEKHNF
jgi:hypothetical protein